MSIQFSDSSEYCACGEVASRACVCGLRLCENCDCQQAAADEARMIIFGMKGIGGCN
jgi:hypothetical protein